MSIHERPSAPVDPSPREEVSGVSNQYKLQQLYMAAAFSISGIARFGYSVVQNDFLRYYGHDYAFPAGTYFLSKTFRIGGQNREAVRAMTIFALMSIAELAQSLPGKESGARFDPKDFIAYGAGATTAYVLDRYTLRKEKKAELSPIASISEEKTVFESPKRRSSKKRKKTQRR